MIFGRVVVVGDRSTASAAFTVGSSLAAGDEAELEIVVDADSDGSEFQAAASGIGVAASSITIFDGEGHLGATAGRVAVETDAGLIVLDRGGDKPSHEVHHLAHHAPCDLLIVRGEREPGTFWDRIAVATDGSATADRAARRGFDLARAIGATVDLVFVGHRATGELIVEDTIAVYGDKVDVEAHILDGHRARQILSVASAASDGLIVVGNKGLEGLSGALLGSVPQRVLDHSDGDVLIVRTVAQVESQLAPGEGGIVSHHGEQLAVYRDEGGELHLMSARCTHMGCTVGWNPVESTFDCPCHGSRFEATGGVVNGPAARPLPPA